MLISFTAKNFRSIKEPVTLDLEAMGQVSELPENVIEAPRHRLLRSAVIYGANGSGKSNIIKAFQAFIRFLKHSGMMSKGAPIQQAEAFALGRDEWSHSPSFFQIEFLKDGSRYRYGYSIDRAKVHSEWLCQSTKIKEHILFERDESGLTLGKAFAEGNSAKKLNLLRDNGLFLPLCAQLNGEISNAVLDSLFKIAVISGIDDLELRPFSYSFIDDDAQKQRLLRALNQADFGITDVFKRKFSSETLPAELRSQAQKLHPNDEMLFVQRQTFNEHGEALGSTSWRFEDSESEGTQKYFHLMAPVLACLDQGQVLFIDELDARLHSKLTLNLIDLFHDPVINAKGAQLIFSTHDTNLLAAELFRRDQIYFTEKNRLAATQLYSLAEFKIEGGKKVRNDASYEKDYLKGRYGAVPVLGDLEAMHPQVQDQ